MKDRIHHLVRGREDTRVRATWRGILPWLVGFAVQLLAVIVIRFGLRNLLDVSNLSIGNVAVLDIGFLGILSAIGLLIAISCGRWLDKRSISDYGIDVSRWDLMDSIAGTVIGGLTYAIPTAVFLQVGGAELTSSSIRLTDTPLLVVSIVLVALIAFFFQTAFEEFVFRGVMLGNFAEGLATRYFGQSWSVITSLLLSSVIFGLSHIITQGGGGAEGRSLQLVITSTLLGLLWGGAYVFTGRLSIPFGLHFGHNIWAAVVLQPTAVALTVPSLGRVAYSISRYELVAGKVVTGGICVLIWLYITRGELSIKSETLTEGSTSTA